jgi:hypothetical protein
VLCVQCRPPNFKVSVKPTGFGSSSAKETHKGALTPSGTPRKQPPGSGFKAPLPPGSPPKSAKVRYCWWGVLLVLGGHCGRYDPRVRTALLHDRDAVLAAAVHWVAYSFADHMSCLVAVYMCPDDVLTMSAQRSESPPGGGEDAAEDAPPPPPAAPVIGGLGTCGAAVVVVTAGGVQLPLAALLPRILRTVLGLPSIANRYCLYSGIMQASLSLQSSWPGWRWRGYSRTTTRWSSPRPSPRYRSLCYMYGALSYAC